MLLYAGISILIWPNDWIGFVPAWVENFGTSQEFMLQSHGIFEVVLGLWILSNKKIRWAALLAALDIASIVIFSGLNYQMLLTTFRDVGLVFMALYLAAADDQQTPSY